MKTIGLIGGMSWESTAEYYRILNEEVKNRLGGFNSAKCILWSVNFNEIEFYQKTNEWEKCGEVLNNAAINIEKAGADFLILCTNTMHKVSDQFMKGVGIPLLHIADMTAEEIQKDNLKKIGLLGTKYTMAENFYLSKIKEKGLDVIVPAEKDQDAVNSIIYDELCKGEIKDDSRSKFIEVINKMMSEGIEGIILGCTEIGLLIKQENISIKVFDTTIIHAKKAVEYALSY
ncbi:aspartate/glutamate racemase family protein [Breznakiella homolactica]|uniref:Aspartate/glutamate racemase family protein n=1 Tax=Breznakiella homolactica TaxID=2798577 RepID=A0A7T7XP93_9SPIR|nr:aspartate/glutamate racemase family protein [Breznakiella homolactica]QQO09927.1 aspartate/glutamate racemase family protein [Breznakiella homolactica]